MNEEKGLSVVLPRIRGTRKMLTDLQGLAKTLNVRPIDIGRVALSIGIFALKTSLEKTYQVDIDKVEKL